MSTVLVTGASGFVGRHLCRILASRGFRVIGAVRSMAAEHQDLPYRLVEAGDITSDVDWAPLLEMADSVVHLASRVHVMQEQSDDPSQEYRNVNVTALQRLLRDAVDRSSKRFVYLSTAKVNGEVNTGRPFSTEDEPDPQDPYSVSKLEAERLIAKFGRDEGLLYTIIRPPLVYGPGVGGNFLRLMTLIDKGTPLPLGKVNNLRSLVSIENLCDLIYECLISENAVGRTFLVSDNQDLSTPALIRKIGYSMSKPARLFSVPELLLRLTARVAGRSEEFSRLTKSFQVDTALTSRVLGWNPPVSQDAALEAAVEWYRDEVRGSPA